MTTDLLSTLPTGTTAFIFPAFVRDYCEDTLIRPADFNRVFKRLLEQASSYIDPELIYFHPEKKHFPDHELRTQYIAYIYGCAIAEHLTLNGIRPDLLAGYSMGIYAALCRSSAIPFKTGLLLIKTAFQEISYVTMGNRYGMGGIIGLSEQDIVDIVVKFPGLEVVNQNSPYSFVLSGRLPDLEEGLSFARSEGAFHARSLNVTVPYHSHLLKAAALQFAKFVYTLDISAPEIPIISVLTQTMLTSPEDLKTELVENLYKPFNWYHTQKQMQTNGTHLFIECGPGTSLKKNARFIEGDCRFLSMDESIQL